ncbi:unnamed protein product [Fraxinus pennsylvanica]|uniref:RanBD1 domain-containing protein n=1 Tax=Fraxinus pennsylvanica TaxID=56036 RepID=A0AAD1Z4K7_9LAMI|nr:unnamed protein product [Fraxinus pennsylvanica]
MYVMETRRASMTHGDTERVSVSHGMMLEDQVAYLLHRYLGNYIRGRNKEALKISVWRVYVDILTLESNTERLARRGLPQNSKIVATYTNSPDVLLWDVESQPNRHPVLGASASCPDLVLTGHQDNAEFALAMCPAEPFVLSGASDYVTGELNFRLYAPYSMLPTMTVQEHQGNDKSCVWHVADFADGALKEETFAIWFASVENCKSFKDKIEEITESLAKKTGDSEEDTTAANL